MKRFIFFIFITIALFINLIESHADDTDLFIVNVQPDTLILLDLSGSMNWDPSGNPASSPNRRIDIAREVLRGLLDDDGDGKIDSKDENSLNIRLGYLRFQDTWNNDDNEPTTGSIRVLSKIGSSYKDIWDRIIDPAETAVGGTPLAASLGEAKTYFTRDVNPVDPAITCRRKFAILISDGADTWGCSGNGGDANCATNEESINPGMKRRRMLTVQKGKELYEAGIKVFVVGFGGGMPECLKRTLNWAAYYGGTDNLLEGNSGNPKAYEITKYGQGCSIDPANAAADPASYPLSGYAFIAENASELSNALKTIVGDIQKGSYSFTAPTIPSVRLVEKDVAYISSFIPNETPFWQGSLGAYRLEDGTLPVDGKGKPLNAPIWVASIPGNRVIKTYVGGGFQDFNSSLTPGDLGVGTNPERDALISSVRNLKLGDIFHSNAVIVGSPSPFFKDTGFSGPGGFYDTNKNRAKVIIVGANDGMLHAFNAATGVEEWAFISNSLLKNLKLMISTHTYYVDSSPKVANGWFYSSPTDKTKEPNEWRTVLVCGLRKGGRHYFALDITDTKSPKYLWEFTDPEMGESWSEPAIGRVKIEVGGELYERWVAFIGGGFDSTGNTGKAFFVIDIKTGEILWKFSYKDKKEKEGEENYVTHSMPAPPTAVDTNLDGYIDKVYIGDLGGQMWVFDVTFDEKNKKSNSQWIGKRLFVSQASNPEKHPIYYQPAVAFDKNKNLWVYFGTGDRENPKDDKGPAERFYAVKDDGLEKYPREEKDLEDVTSSNTFNLTSKKGWFIILEKSGKRLEKVLAKPLVFNRLVYFTSYIYTETADPCSVAGIAKLYIVEYLSGGGALGVDDLSDLEGTPFLRSKEIGIGVPSAPVISVGMGGKASVMIGTTSGQIYSDKSFSLPTNKEIIYWREVIP